MGIETMPIINMQVCSEVLYGVVHSPTLYLLVGLIIIDFLTGTAKAAKTGQLSSKIGINGLVNHLLVMLLVVFIKFFSRLLGFSVMLVALPIGFSYNYFLSIVENFNVLGIPFPDAVLKRIKDGKETFDKEIVVREDDEIVVRKKTKRKGKDR